MSKKLLAALPYAAWALLAVFGLWGMGLRLTTGQQHAAFGNYVPWGLWVGSYVYFSGLSAGFIVVSGVAAHSGRPALSRFGPLALMAAVCSLLVALVSIAVDLGHINRAIEILYHANLRSVEAWLIFIYSTELGLVCLGNVLALRASIPRSVAQPGLRGWLARLLMRGLRVVPEHVAHVVHHRMALVEIPLALFFFGAVGALFATVSARAYWHHPLLPILFLVGAVLSAAGAMAPLLYLFGEEHPSWPGALQPVDEALQALVKPLLALLAVSALLEWAQVSIPLWQGLTEGAEPLRVLLFGKFWWSFWVVHVLLGVAVPAFLLVRWPRSRGAIAIAGTLAAVTFFTVRLGQIIPPQTTELLAGQAESWHSLRASLFYFPNLFEWGVLAAILAFGWAAFWAAVRFLPVLPALDDVPEVEGEGHVGI